MKNLSRRILPGILVFITALLLIGISFLQNPKSQALADAGLPKQLSRQNSPEVSRCYEFLHEVMRQIGYIPDKTRESDSGPLVPEGKVSCYLMGYTVDGDGNSKTGVVLEAVESSPSTDYNCVLATETIEAPYQSEMTTFKEFEARTIYLSQNVGSAVTPRTHEVKDLSWCMYKWDRNFEFRANTSSSATELHGQAVDPEPIAELMLQLMDDYFPLIKTKEVILEEPSATPLVAGESDDSNTVILLEETPNAANSGQPNSPDRPQTSLGFPVIATALIVLGVLAGLAVIGIVIGIIVHAGNKQVKTGSMPYPSNQSPVSAPAQYATNTAPPSNQPGGAFSSKSPDTIVTPPLPIPSIPTADDPTKSNENFPQSQTESTYQSNTSSSPIAGPPLSIPPRQPASGIPIPPPLINKDKDHEKD